MGATVELAKIVDALEMMLEDWRSFLNVETGEVESVSLDILGEAEESEEKDPQSFENYDGEFELATKIVENRDKFLRLPTRFDIHEWSIMESFAESMKYGRIREELLRAVHGGGAYRRFRSAVARHSVQSDWYQFRDDALKQIAIEWCEANNLTWK